MATKGKCPTCGSRSAWEGALCADCYRTHKDDLRTRRRVVAAEQNKVAGLSPITDGTDKQLAWAEELRSEAIRSLEGLTPLPSTRPPNWPPELDEACWVRATQYYGCGPRRRDQSTSSTSQTLTRTARSSAAAACGWTRTTTTTRSRNRNP